MFDFIMVLVALGMFAAMIALACACFPMVPVGLMIFLFMISGR